MIHTALWVAAVLFLGWIGLVVLFLVFGIAAKVFEVLFAPTPQDKRYEDARRMPNGQTPEEYQRGAMRDSIKAHTLPTHKGKPINRID